jgi:hypothetical protein
VIVIHACGLVLVILDVNPGIVINHDAKVIAPTTALLAGRNASSAGYLYRDFDSAV